LIAIAIVAGVVLFGGLIVAVVVYRFVSSPDGKKIVSAVSSGAALLSEATSAPGTSELRALGCESALVIDAAKAQAIADSFTDAGTADLSSAQPLQVICVRGRGPSAPAPACDTIAATYVKAVGRAAAPFAVSMGARGKEAECEASYAADGTRAPESSPH
jgi:hypothetical protein